MRLFNLFAATLLCLASLPGEAAGLRFSLVKTAETKTLDAFTVEGGQWTQTAIASHMAVLIEHHAATLLFDTSLGRQVDSQFDSEMPWYDKPLLQYGEVRPVRDQIERDGIRVDRILLSHAHWDHASGLADFPEVPVWAPYAEIEFSRIATPPAILPSQFKHGVKWLPYEFAPTPFLGFAASLDLFGDGSLVLVPLSGHTPGLGRAVHHPRGRPPVLLQRRCQLAPGGLHRPRENSGSAGAWSTTTARRPAQCCSRCTI